MAYLEQFASLIRQEEQVLSQLISEETGKPFWESKTEAQTVSAKVAISIQAYQHRTSDQITQEGTMRSGVRYKSHGVMAVLGPFNFPAHLSNGHIVPALLAGNTILYKPSELTPGVAAFITACWEKVGLPKGVLNLLQGGAETAKLMLKESIQGVAFTGSYQTGVAINQALSHKPEIILALEMGGNNPLIIDEIKDMSAGVYQTIVSAFMTAGQRCSCARRLMLPNTAFGDLFLTKLIQATQRIHPAPPTHNPEPFIGPVIRNAHAKQHIAWQTEWIHRGAEALLPMRLLDDSLSFLTPGIIDMTPIQLRPDIEIFAPLLQVYRYDTFDEALQLANQTQYGLSASLFSDDATRFQTFYHTVNAGLLYWNRPTTGALSQLPFGGVGHSGNHRPSAYFAADYCAYPIATIEQNQVTLPDNLLPGVSLDD